MYVKKSELDLVYIKIHCYATFIHESSHRICVVKYKKLGTRNKLERNFLDLQNRENIWAISTLSFYKRISDSTMKSNGYKKKTFKQTLSSWMRGKKSNPYIKLISFSSTFFEWFLEQIEIEYRWYFPLETKQNKNKMKCGWYFFRHKINWLA